MAAQQKFFEIIHPGIDIDLIGKQKYWIGASIILVLLTLIMLPVNAYVLKDRGHALNWGVDFRGGTEILVEFSKPLPATAVRDAVTKSGYHNAEVVQYGAQGSNAYMIRMGAVSIVSAAQAEQAKASLAKVGDATLNTQRGFDFTEGGDKIYLRFDKPVEPQVLADALKTSGISTTQVRPFGRADDHTYEATLIGLDTEVTKGLNAHLGEGTVKQILSVQSVGAKAGGQLRDDGFRALGGAILLIVVYVAFRFDFRYGPGTIVALLHDAVITVGAFAVTYKEFSLTTLAALLTIIGFSMNDTIVVFDRIRENAARYRDRRFDRVVNQSINETLSRTILTSATVFFVTLAMNIFGTGVIRDFAFAMNVGVIVGTYSSIFIASPILIWLTNRYNQSQKTKQLRPDRGRRPVRQEEEPVET
ncbi:MAG TPA: protein translocase subunit SecF [Polyangia bacterium]|nr:protein translocase subunit SecF [Polyangia bacterium]